MNLEKLDEAIAYIEAHPELHDQDSWFANTDCGTTACLAGTVVLLAGWRPRFSGPGISSGDVTLGDECRWVADVAAEILGLSDEQRESLFYADDIDEIRGLRAEIAAGELV